MSSGKSEREQRLAQALRANLRRRKGQVRDRTEGDEVGAPPADPQGSEPAAGPST